MSKNFDGTSDAADSLYTGKSLSVASWVRPGPDGVPIVESTWSTHETVPSADGWHCVAAVYTTKRPRVVYWDGYGGRHYFRLQWKLMVWWQKLMDRVLHRRRVC